MFIDIKSAVNPNHSQSHIRYSFPLDRPVKALYLYFEYEPKLLDDNAQGRKLLEQSLERYVLPEQKELALSGIDRYLPLSNLITISVDDPNEYRGACHRHDSIQQLFLSESAASPGLLPGEIITGTWTITLSLHSIVTGSCTYHLKAWAEEEEAI
ncbi:hypothetical protein [Paenibacillus pinihumi]|uniref:hypothetical protein n=1 Tax=Paenibacillus pinihumi TaxID=669462 RepID=UPI0003FCB0BE|nr:hypothetical protein [Paenibacillus pinihumi]